MAKDIRSYIAKKDYKELGAVFFGDTITGEIAKSVITKFKRGFKREEIVLVVAKEEVIRGNSLFGGILGGVLDVSEQKEDTTRIYMDEVVVFTEKALWISENHGYTQYYINYEEIVSIDYYSDKCTIKTESNIYEHECDGYEEAEYLYNFISDLKEYLDSDEDNEGLRTEEEIKEFIFNNEHVVLCQDLVQIKMRSSAC